MRTSAKRAGASCWQGRGIDSYVGYGQRGSFSVVEHAVSSLVELFPIFSRLRLMRQWAGIVDTCPDACPIIGATPVDGLYFNCGVGNRGIQGDARLWMGVRLHTR